MATAVIPAKAGIQGRKVMALLDQAADFGGFDQGMALTGFPAGASARGGARG
jgi:hypothetical protein